VEGALQGARWALLKNPEDLTDRQAATLAAIRRHGEALWRSCQRKEELRAKFAGGLTDDETAELLDRRSARVARSRLESLVKAGRTIRKHRDGIFAAIRHGLADARLEASASVCCSPCAAPPGSTPPSSNSPWSCSPPAPST
jgi:transposase